MKYLSFFAVLAFITLFSVRPVLAEEANAPTNMPVGDYVQEATPSKPGVNGKRFVPPGIDAIRQVDRLLERVCVQYPLFEI
jgi:hypothetical protein